MHISSLQKENETVSKINSQLKSEVSSLKTQLQAQTDTYSKEREWLVQQLTVYQAAIIQQQLVQQQQTQQQQTTQIPVQPTQQPTEQLKIDTQSIVQPDTLPHPEKQLNTQKLHVQFHEDVLQQKQSTQLHPKISIPNGRSRSSSTGEPPHTSPVSNSFPYPLATASRNPTPSPRNPITSPTSTPMYPLATASFNPSTVSPRNFTPVFPITTSPRTVPPSPHARGSPSVTVANPSPSTSQSFPPPPPPLSVPPSPHSAPLPSPISTTSSNITPLDLSTLPPPPSTLLSPPKAAAPPPPPPPVFSTPPPSQPATSSAPSFSPLNLKEALANKTLSAVRKPTKAPASAPTSPREAKPDFLSELKKKSFVTENRVQALAKFEETRAASLTTKKNEITQVLNTGRAKLRSTGGVSKLEEERKRQDALVRQKSFTLQRPSSAPANAIRQTNTRNPPSPPISIPVPEPNDTDTISDEDVSSDDDDMESPISMMVNSFLLKEPGLGGLMGSFLKPGST